MIIAIDIETKRGLRAQPDNFLLGVVVKQHDMSHKTFYDPKIMWDYILELGRRVNKDNKLLHVYSANHSFDWMLYAPMHHPQLVQLSKKMFLYKIMETDEIFIERKQNMIKQNRPVPKQKRGYITFLDLFSIYNSSIRSTTSAGLKRVGELINKPKSETPSYLTKESLSIKRTAKLKFTEKQLKETEQYCINDTEIIIHAINAVKDKLKQEKIRINFMFSIHQIAMNRFMKKLRQHDYTLLTWDPNMFITGGYRFPEPKYPCITFSGNTGKHNSRFCRGGIVQAYKHGKFKRTYKIDCNGFWQYILSVMKIPDLQTEHKVTEPLMYMKINEVLNKIGYSHVIIQVPEIDHGILPVRVVQDGTMNNIFPNHKSHIVGHYTNTELKYAVSLGYKIIHIDYSVFWDELKTNAIKEIVHETYNLRKESKTQFSNWFYKQMGNSFVGKFTQYYHDRTIKNIPIEQINEYKKQDYYVTDSFDRYYTVEKTHKQRRQVPYYAPIMYALVTANARIEHHKVISKFGSKKVLYVDTDSVILKNTSLKEIHNKVEIGPELGQWKFENRMKNNKPVPEQAQIWKEKYYQFSSQYHMAGVPLKDIQSFKRRKDKSVIKRKRIITKNMTNNLDLVGTMTTETIEMKHKLKPERNVYIDALPEDTDNMAKRVFELVTP